LRVAGRKEQTDCDIVSRVMRIVIRLKFKIGIHHILALSSSTKSET
jgi:hypothetical protein